MKNSFMKQATAVALLAGAAFGANAASIELGAIGFGAPTPFSGSVLQAAGTFTDTFTFTLPANGGSGYSVINFPLSIPGVGTFNTLFNAISLYSAGANGSPGGGDDTFLASAVGADSGTLSITFGPTAAGRYYLDVFGRTDGTLGGLYSGSISVTAVPEPESYAMLLAGLGVMGAIAIRRNKSKSG